MGKQKILLCSNVIQIFIQIIYIHKTYLSKHCINFSVNYLEKKKYNYLSIKIKPSIIIIHKNSLLILFLLM